MDQDYELIVAANLHTCPQNSTSHRKSVLLLYNCAALPIPDLANKLVDLGHTVVMPTTAVPAPVPRGLRSVLFYPAHAPFEKPSWAIQNSIHAHVHERTGEVDGKLFTIIVLGTPRVRSASNLSNLLNTWSGMSFHLVTEANRAPWETWRDCFDRHEDTLERRRRGLDWSTYNLEAMNGIWGLSWKDIDEPNVQRAATERQAFRDHLLLHSTLQRPAAHAYLLSRIQRLMHRRSGDPCLQNGDRFFLCFGTFRRWEVMPDRQSAEPSSTRSNGIC